MLLRLIDSFKKLSFSQVWNDIAVDFLVSITKPFAWYQVSSSSNNSVNFLFKFQQ
jgi:hypothetical protein